MSDNVTNIEDHKAPQWEGMNIRQRIWLFTQTFEGVEKKRTGARENEKFFNLDDVYNAAVPAMDACGLGAANVVKMTPDGGNCLVVELFCVDSHEVDENNVRSPDAVISSELPLPKTNDGRAFGSMLTYMRRYGVVTMLNIRVPGDDDDGLAAEMDRLAEEEGSGGSKVSECKNIIRQLDNGEDRALNYIAKQWGLDNLDRLSLKQAASLKRTLSDILQKEQTPDVSPAE